MNINLAIIERAKAGEPLTAAELNELGASDVLSLGMLADEVRRARVGDTVTYARDAESRLTALPATLKETVAAIRAAQLGLKTACITKVGEFHEHFRRRRGLDMPLEHHNILSPFGRCRNFMFEMNDLRRRVSDEAHRQRQIVAFSDVELVILAGKFRIDDVDRGAVDVAVTHEGITDIHSFRRDQ